MHLISSFVFFSSSSSLLSLLFLHANCHNELKPTWCLKVLLHTLTITASFNVVLSWEQVDLLDGIFRILRTRWANISAVSSISESSCRWLPPSSVFSCNWRLKQLLSAFISAEKKLVASMTVARIKRREKKRVQWSGQLKEVLKWEDHYFFKVPLNCFFYFCH